jgi:hypothetical protein
MPCGPCFPPPRSRQMPAQHYLWGLLKVRRKLPNPAFASEFLMPGFL